MKKTRVYILCGSDSDLDSVQKFCESFDTQLEIAIHSNVSCHRVPNDVRKMVSEEADLRIPGADWLIGVGGKAFAQPGIIDAWCQFFKRRSQVAGVALGEPDSKALRAAILSIEELPGQPVLLDEGGSAYVGIGGLEKLLRRIESGNIPPEKSRAEKLARWWVWSNFPKLV